MKVIIIAPHPERVKGGMSTVIQNYKEYKNTDNIEKIYIYTSEGGQIFNKINSMIKGIFKVIREICMGNVDLVHINIASGMSFYRKSIYCLVAKIFGKKYILHLHGGRFIEFYSESNKFSKKYIKNIFNQAKYIITLSKEASNGVGKFSKTKIDILSNSIFIPKKNYYDSDNENILMLSRLVKEKGIYDLLDAIEILKKKYKKIKLVIAGDGEIDKIKEVIMSKRLEKNIELVGWIDNEKKEQILKRTSIFILPSYYEAMPMSILEAMGYGIPIISTKVGSISEIIENTFLVRPGDVEEICNKIENLYINVEKRQEVSSRNYAEAKKRFCIEKHINQLHNIYCIVNESNK